MTYAIDITIDGVPCIAVVTSYEPEIHTNWHCLIEHAEPPSAASIDFDLRDEDGKESQALDALYQRLTRAEQDRLEQEIIRKYEEECHATDY